MAVKIRLKRIGRKKQAHYRIVVSESRNPRGGKVIETVGTYSPYLKEKSLDVDLARIEEWRSKGAKPTEAVVKLLRRARRSEAKPSAAPAPGKGGLKPEVAETPPEAAEPPEDKGVAGEQPESED